ncbi:MAG: response regulator [Gammaproteobacteria bacterium]|nr:response regulator [Gammaproteobacteria bacterium]
MFFIANKKKVLIIDDNPSPQRLLHIRLKIHHNVKVIKAMDGKNGLIQANVHNPDLIILEWTLPDIQGIEVLERLRCERKTKNTSILILTGRNKPGNIEDAFNLGADAYLTKMVSLLISGKKIDEMLNSPSLH